MRCNPCIRESGFLLVWCIYMHWLWYLTMCALWYLTQACHQCWWCKPIIHMRVIIWTVIRSCSSFSFFLSPHCFFFIGAVNQYNHSPPPTELVWWQRSTHDSERLVIETIQTPPVRTVHEIGTNMTARNAVNTRPETYQRGYGQEKCCWVTAQPSWRILTERSGLNINWSGSKGQRRSSGTHRTCI